MGQKNEGERRETEGEGRKSGGEGRERKRMKVLFWREDRHIKGGREGEKNEGERRVSQEKL